ncbi:hypothetical protein NEMIN01_0839 [Nematocida minor]|uniref:uncharacterized protein n=1 Tax=Nematocida minor TaxID=1912983 RepID=UPI0022210333|nr:uncharacterized protein NEMIN01_0839 [Nematocida minor]KAI5190054.1 hypothetical protein NEMIN01_0839 [Nematocida minor]
MRLDMNACMPNEENRENERMKTKLLELARTDYENFLKMANRLKVPYKSVRNSIFRYSCIHSYNYGVIQSKYKLEGELNASLIENSKDFIAMEYPTKHAIDCTDQLLLKSQCGLVISLIGDHPPWEQDFLQVSYSLDKIFSAEEFLCYVSRSGKDTSKINYRDMHEVIEKENKNFVVERYKTKKKEDAYIFRIKCLNWVDKAPPSLNMLKAIDILYKAWLLLNIESGPVIVHCLAGVGRTGTFIFYSIFRDSIVNGKIEESAEEKLFFFVDLFVKLRNKRTWMIESKEQLDFLYTVFIKNSISEIV